MYVTSIFYFIAYSCSQHSANPWLLLVLKYQRVGKRRATQDFIRVLRRASGATLKVGGGGGAD